MQTPSWLLGYFLLFCTTLLAQSHVPTRADSLRGELTSFRSCYDVTYYDLEIQPDIPRKRIAGTNRIHFTATETFNTLQLDLYPYMEIHSIEYNSLKLSYQRIEGAVFVTFPYSISAGTKGVLEVVFVGQPKEAVNPPWDGGWVWKKDPKGRDWIGLACEGEGASSWFPCKDHPTDEPDSIKTRIIVPQELVAVSNGNLRRILKESGGRFKYEWAVSYPINLYNITINIADYAEIEERWDGKYDLNYYVLRDNEEKARSHFQQVKEILTIYEKYFGTYPFPKDGYALVETPFWGMEHQSAIAYGNEYRNNEYGVDFIILHETAHEWFGNSLSMQDKSDMWIHEAFASYAEALYIESKFGYEKYQEYLSNQHLPRIQNISVILAPRNVAFDSWADSDMYFKGSMMLHSLRIAVHDDKLFFATLKKFCESFRHQILNTQQAIAFFNRELNHNYDAFFYQYLKYATVPVFTYKLAHVSNKEKRETTLQYKWDADVDDFDFPITLTTKTGVVRLPVTTKWQTKTFPFDKELAVNLNNMQGLFMVKNLGTTTQEEKIPTKPTSTKKKKSK